MKVVGECFISGDIGGQIKIWDVQTGAKLRTIDIGSAVQDFCFLGKFLVTVGGINGAMGVVFWDYDAGVRVATLYDTFEHQDSGSFNKIVIHDNRVLIDGFNHAIVFSVDTTNWGVREVLRVRNHVMALTRTCVFKAKYNEFDGHISVKDYWNDQLSFWKGFPDEF